MPSTDCPVSVATGRRISGIVGFVSWVTSASGQAGGGRGHVPRERALGASYGIPLGRVAEAIGLVARFPDRPRSTRGGVGRGVSRNVRRWGRPVVGVVPPRTPKNPKTPSTHKSGHGQEIEGGSVHGG